MMIRVLSMIAAGLFLIQAAPTFAQEASLEETERFDFAQGLLERELYDMATAEYQKFIAAYPQSVYLPKAYLAIGESYFLSKDFTKAIEAFNQFKKLYPDSEQYPSALLRLGQIYISQKNFDEALRELTTIDVEARLKGQMLQSFDFYIGKVKREKNDLNVALTYFQKASAVADAFTYTSNAFEQIAEIEIQNAHYPEAVEAYAKALQTASDENFESYFTYKLGETYFLSGKYTEAIEQFRQVLTQFPNFEMTRETIANLLSAYFNLAQYDQVLNEYKNNTPLIKEEAEYFNIHLTAGRALLELKKYDEALVVLEKISGFSGLKDDDKRKLTLTKADILIKQKKYQEVLTLVEGQLPGSADDADKISFLKAQGYFGLGDFEKASGFFQDVNVNHTSSDYAQASLLGQAHSRHEAGDYKAAEELFLKYYNLEKDEALKSEAFYYAALMNVKLNEFPKAVQQAEEYLKTFPNGTYYEADMLLLDDLYTKTNEPAKAVALLKEYLTHPEKIQKMDAVNFLLGYAQQLAGQTDEALKTYAQILPNKDDPKYYAFGLKNTAVIFLTQGKNDEAAAAFDGLIMEVDNNYLELKTYLWVCEQFLMNKKFNDVSRIAEKAEKQFPNEGMAETAYFKGEAARGLNDMENALKYYDAVLSSPVKNMYTGGAHIGKGLCLVDAKKMDEAKIEFQKAIDENPDDSTMTLRARFELARIADEQKNPEEALRFYLLIGTIYEDDNYVPESLLRAAGILENLNRKEEALKIYREIVDQYPNSPQAKTAKAKVTVTQ